MSEEKTENSKDKEDFINPIDEDHITENPDTLAYPHHRGSFPVAPTKQGEIKIKAIGALQHQTDAQLQQIKEQMELLAKQATELQNRIEVSERIYGAEMRFKPTILHTYHLYEKEDGSHTLSMVAPDQWGRKGCPFYFVASVKLLADHTWEVIKKNDED